MLLISNGYDANKPQQHTIARVYLSFIEPVGIADQTRNRIRSVKE